ncbi:hypothetical protein U9M48_023787 [Paspalum notatum var. saurae]|uniref:Uncharacterized protein n=1 Tax=Paspalum notatum var. saurae TaxID=547442 RepID=A0AAQ3TQ37_PASNO
MLAAPARRAQPLPGPSQPLPDTRAAPMASTVRLSPDASARLSSHGRRHDTRAAPLASCAHGAPTGGPPPSSCAPKAWSPAAARHPAPHPPACTARPSAAARAPRHRPPAHPRRGHRRRIWPPWPAMVENAEAATDLGGEGAEVEGRRGGSAQRVGEEKRSAEVTGSTKLRSESPVTLDVMSGGAEGARFATAAKVLQRHAVVLSRPGRRRGQRLDYPGGEPRSRQHGVRVRRLLHEPRKKHHGIDGKVVPICGQVIELMKWPLGCHFLASPFASTASLSADPATTGITALWGLLPQDEGWLSQDWTERKDAAENTMEAYKVAQRWRTGTFCFPYAAEASCSHHYTIAGGAMKVPIPLFRPHNGIQRVCI